MGCCSVSNWFERTGSIFIDDDVIKHDAPYVVYICVECKRMYIQATNDQAREVVLNRASGRYERTSKHVFHRWREDQEKFDYSKVVKNYSRQDLLYHFDRMVARSNMTGLCSIEDEDSMNRRIRKLIETNG